MERARPQRSKISGIPDFPSDDRFSSKQAPVSLRGNRFVQTQSDFPKVASHSRSHSGGIPDDELFTFELGLTSSKQASGTPMKKLLDKEMSKEMESRRRSPNVVAKLMGLEGLPPQQSAYKAGLEKPECQFQMTRSAERGQQSFHLYAKKSSKRSSKDEQEFKDVFEVLEPSRIGSCSYPHSQYSNFTDVEMAFIRQKFMDAKRLSTDEKLHNSKEFNDALDILDSNKDLLLKFLQQPDLLFTKHLRDLQEAPQPLCGRFAEMKSSGTRSKSGKEPLHRNRSASPYKHRERSHQNSPNSSKSEYEQKGESISQPTRIVVLKPNLGKVSSPSNTASSPFSSNTSQSERRKDRDIPLSKNREIEVSGRKKFQHDKSRESRQLAKEITRQMRSSFSSSSPKCSSLSFKGYAGDESSCSMSGNESASEPETWSTSSRCSFDLTRHSRPLTSQTTESSVSREAKRRLSERWRLTHKSADMCSASRGSTLADMLAADKERRASRFDDVMKSEGCRNKSRADKDEPLGISSKDGWKDGRITALTRSRSLPSSSTALGSPRAFIREDKYVIPRENFNGERVKGQKCNADKRDVNRSSRSYSKRSYRLEYTIRESNGVSPEPRAVNSQVGVELEFDSLVENKFEEVVETSAGNLTNRSPVLEKTCPSGLDSTRPEISACTLLTDVCNTEADDDLGLRQEKQSEPCNGSPSPANQSTVGAESLSNCKEADQPSPVSVLEVPFTDDVSSCSECFESLNADLQGLRMQLQLLKLESESYEEEDTVVSSDDEDVSTRRLTSQRTWEYGYVTDVLLHSGLDSTNPEAFFATWHSQGSPVSPSVFEQLEKKYHDDVAMTLKFDRRLLFDRINSEILKMYRQFTDLFPWLRSPATVSGQKWPERELRDELIWVLEEREAVEEVAEREEKWADIRSVVDVMGREFEKLLFDDLLEELLV